MAQVFIALVEWDEGDEIIGVYATRSACEQALIQRNAKQLRELPEYENDRAHYERLILETGVTTEWEEDTLHSHSRSRFRLKWWYQLCYEVWDVTA